MAVGFSPAFAVDDDGHFELGDGASTPGSADIEGSETQAGPDWANIFDGNGNVVDLFGGVAATFASDDLSIKGAVDNTIFASSNKNNDLIGTWNWDTGNNPPKDDQVNAYAYAKIVNGHLRIYGGVERIANEGDSHVDIQFYQSEIGLDKMPPCGSDGTDGPRDTAPCEFTGEKQVNDIVVSMDFVKGGGLGELSVRRWNGTEYVLIAGADLPGEGCNTAGGLPGDTICAFNNGVPVNGGPWVNYDKSGAEITNIPVNGFTEFGIDVTDALGGSASICYATVIFKTRSSQSFTAELKDFSLHPFEKCDTTVTTEIHNASHTKLADDYSTPNPFTSTVPVFTVVHDKATVAGITGIPPTGSVKFYRYSKVDCAVDDDNPEVLHDTVTLPAGTDTTKSVESKVITLDTSGSFGFKAVYSGDSNYPEESSGCEQLTVSTIDSSVNTQVLRGTTDVTNSAIDMSTDPAPVVRDKATVMGTTGTDPTGSVTFRRYSKANCTGTYVDETQTLPTDDDPTDGMATALSNPLTLDTEAFHCWQVFYSGDDVYSASASMVGEPICTFDFNPDLTPPATQ